MRDVGLLLFSLHLKNKLSQVLLLEMGPFAKSTFRGQTHQHHQPGVTELASMKVPDAASLGLNTVQGRLTGPVLLITSSRLLSGGKRLCASLFGGFTYQSC